MSGPAAERPRADALAAVALRVAEDGRSACLATGEGEYPVVSRLHAEGAWRNVPCRPGRIGGLAVEVAWTVVPAPFPGGLSCRAALTNAGDRPVRLGPFHVLEGRDLGPSGAEPVVYLDSGGGWFAGAVRAKDSCPPYGEKWTTFVAPEDAAWAREAAGGSLERGAHHSLAGVMVLHRGGGFPAWLLSFVAPPERCLAAPMLVADPASGSVRAFALSSDFAGRELLPGERISSEEALVGLFPDPCAALEEWAAACAALRGLAVHPRPPMGWLSWYGYRLTQSAEETLRTADLIRREFGGLGVEYIQLDLGYNKGNLPGEWFETNERYPRGLARLAADLRGRGFKLGVWVAPFLVAAESAFARERPEALVRDGAGRPRACGTWSWEPKCPLHMVDPTHPEGAAFLRRVAAHMKAEGAVYFKFDFTNRLASTGGDFVLHDGRKVRGAEVYRHGLAVLREALSPDDYVYWCSNLIHPGIGLGDTTMAACDIGNTGFSEALAQRGDDAGLRFFGRQAATTVSRWFLHDRMIRLNADGLNVAPPADIEECRLRATLVAMTGGQVFLGDRFDLCEPDRFDLIRRVMPPYGRAARPVDIFESPYPDGLPRLWHLRVGTGWDGRDLVAVFNCERDMDVAVDFRRLGLPDGTPFHLWEFWEGRYLGRRRGGFTLPSKRATARLVAIVPERAHPWVLSTDVHFTQGACELESVRWDGEGATLSGVFVRPPGSRGSLIVSVPAPYRFPGEEIAPGIFRHPLEARADRTPWSVRFSAAPRPRG